jgi:ribosomal protein L11 methyltransferase
MLLVEIKAAIPGDEIEIIEDRLIESEITGWNLVQDVISQQSWIVGVFPNETEARARWEELCALCAEVKFEIPAVRAMPEQEWRDSYKAHFKAWRFGQLHWVPLWEKEQFLLPAGHEVLWLDPGLAFGTGNHETTRLCVERLVTWANTNGQKGRVLDAGCGSGILALSAAKLGFLEVAGFDNDPEAVRVSQENAAMNDLIGKVDFYEGDLVTGLQGRQADLVLANILADILMRFPVQLIQAVAPKGQLVLSGILAVESEQVISVFSSHAPDWSCETRQLGEWSDVVLTRP